MNALAKGAQIPGRNTNREKSSIYRNVVDLILEYDDRATEELLAALKDPDPEVRALAAVLLSGYKAPPNTVMSIVENSFHRDSDLLVKWATATAIVLWDNFPNRKTRDAAGAALADMAARTLQIAPDATGNFTQEAAEMGSRVASAELFLVILPMLIGTRG
jgi:hypothetical protein